MRAKYLLLIFTLFWFLFGCQEESPSNVKIPPQAPNHKESKQQTITETDARDKSGVAGMVPEEDAQKDSVPAKGSEKIKEERIPPAPPVKEDFQGQPKLSLFPRVGDFQPPPDSDRHPYWRTFIDHLVKVTGVAENQEDGSRGWVFRSIKSIDSLGYFAPLEVNPNTTYTVTFKLVAELPEGASAGIGVLEFDEFLWVGEQYSEEIFQKHYRGVHEGKRLTGKTSGEQTFSFTTGPDTRMIHLVLFREGTHDRNALMFDDIEIK